MRKDKEGSIYVKSLVEDGTLFPEFPYECECGSDLMTNDMMTSLFCSNLNCPTHQGYGLEAALKIWGIKAPIGEVTANSITQWIDINSPIEVLKPENIERIRMMGTSATYDLADELDKFRKNPVKLWKIVDSMNLKNLGTVRAQKLFSNISSPTEFFSGFKQVTDMIVYISRQLGISGQSSTVYEICEILLGVSDILGRSETYINYEKIDKTKSSIRIAITGDVTLARDSDGKVFLPRERFADYLSDNYNVNVIIGGFSIKETSILIMDTDMTNNSKFKKAQANHIPIMQSDQFEEWIGKKYGRR